MGGPPGLAPKARPPPPCNAAYLSRRAPGIAYSEKRNGAPMRPASVDYTALQGGTRGGGGVHVHRAYRVFVRRSEENEEVV